MEDLNFDASATGPAAILAVYAVMEILVEDDPGKKDRLIAKLREAAENHNSENKPRPSSQSRSVTRMLHSIADAIAAKYD